MKKIVLSIIVSGLFLNGFADECKHLWFSQKQQNKTYLKDKEGFYDRSKIRIIYGKLENGNIVQYTEMNNEKKYLSNYDDMKYVGCGYYEKTEVLNNLDTKNYHSLVEKNEEKYKEKMLKNYEQLNQK